MQDLNQMLYELLAGTPAATGPTMPQHGRAPMAQPMPMPQLSMPGSPGPMAAGRSPMAGMLPPREPMPMPPAPPGGGMMPGGMGPMDVMPMPPKDTSRLGMGPMPPGFGLQPEQGPMAQPGMGGFMPPVQGPNLLAPPQNPMPPAGGPQPVAAPMQQPVQDFRSKAAGLFGGGGKTLQQILADTMAGVAGSDPTAPPIKAFASGYTGARASKKLREKDATDAEDKAYEREGTELDRAAKRQDMSEKGKMAPLARAKTAAEVKESLQYTRDQKDKDALVKESIERDEFLTLEEKIQKWNDYKAGKLNQPGAQPEWSPESGQAPPKGHRRYNKSGGWVEWDGERWVDQNGQEVPTS